jgi:hypothetical protein
MICKQTLKLGAVTKVKISIQHIYRRILFSLIAFILATEMVKTLETFQNENY